MKSQREKQTRRKNENQLRWLSRTHIRRAIERISSAIKNVKVGHNEFAMHHLTELLDQVVDIQLVNESQINMMRKQRMKIRKMGESLRKLRSAQSQGHLGEGMDALFRIEE